MSDVDHDAEFDKAFEGFGEDETTPPADPPKGDDTSAPDPKVTTPPKKDDDEEDKADADKDKPATGKPDDTAESGEEKPTSGDGDKSDDSKEDGDKGGEDKPTTPKEPKPLTKEDIEDVVTNIRTEERNSAKELDTETQEVMETYYPDGLSRTLVDQNTGKELNTPQDVIDAAGGDMSMEEAAQWLMNKKFELNKQVDEIESNARKIAENTITFRRDALTAVKKYEPLFKKYPHLQEKVWNGLKAQIKTDDKEKFILSAPDVLAHYDFYLEPYQLAFEHSTNQPATQPTQPGPETPPAPKPGADDRLDNDAGDGGVGEVDDPNDFGQQVKKELAKGM